MEHSTFWPLDNPRDEHEYSALVEDNNVDALCILGGHPIHNQFWQYSLCNVYWLWKPDELHQLLLGLVKDLLHWLLKYMKARNVMDQFDNQFSLVPRDSSLQHFSKPIDSLKSRTWQCQKIRGMIGTMGVHCTQILDCSRNDSKTAVENASDEMIMGAVPGLCQFCLLVRQQNHSDLSIEELDNALKRYYQTNGIFRDQKMWKSGKAKVDHQFTMESHHLREHEISKIRAAMEPIVCGAEKATTMNCRHVQVHPNRAREAATSCSDADHQKVIVWFDQEIHQVTSAKCKLSDK